MSSKPLVPSKDALRVLRSLAYSPPAAFVGVAGALCGVVTVQYHERRKVRQAERILETKRKLHTITQGRGSARLASMFEAAERGEDFTINKSGKSRNARKRAHSALATSRESEGSTDWKSKGRLREDDSEISRFEYKPWNQSSTSAPTNATYASSKAEKQLSANLRTRTPLIQETDADSAVEAQVVASSEVWMPFSGQNNTRRPDNLTASKSKYESSKPLPDRPSPDFKQVNIRRREQGAEKTEVPSTFPKTNARSKHKDPADDSSQSAKFWRNANTWQNSRDRNHNQTWRELFEVGRDIASTMPARVLDILEQPSRFQSPHAITNKHAEQQVTDLNPVTESPMNTDKHSSILIECDPASSFTSSPFNLLQPWQSAPNRENAISDGIDVVAEHSTNGVLPQSSAISQPDLYLESSAPIPPFRSKRQFLSRYDLGHPMVRSALSFVGADRYEWVFKRLMDYKLEHGGELALPLLEQTMHRYTSTNERPDFALVQALFLDFTRVFDAHSIKPLLWRYVEKYLAEEMPRLEVVSLLYPLCGAGDHSKDQYYYFLATEYLQAIQRKGYSLDQQVIELRKVIAGTQLCNIGLHEHLMMPVLRAHCYEGSMSSAQALFDEMVAVHKVNVTAYSIRVLINGYARAGSWSKVKSIFDNYQDYDQLQDKVYAIAGHLVAAVKEYCQSNSPEKVVNFVKHTIGTYQIQPVGGLTREIIGVCLRHRRYDLVVSWMEMVQFDFPHVDAGTSSSSFAYEVASVWKDINASIEDILNGCRALATHALRDPFSKTFRSSISEAASRYLGTQLKELRQEIGSEVPHGNLGNIYAFEESLKRLNDSAAVRMYGSRARLLLAQILDEIKAFHFLDALCRGHNPPLESAPRPTNIQQPYKAPEVDQRTKLGNLTEIQQTLMTEYNRGSKLGQVTGHDSLRETVRLLINQGRVADAFDLIEVVYDSPWARPPTGQEFDLEIFTKWLELARTLKSGARVRTVLWALVDASPQLQLTSSIILLARIAAPKVSITNVKRATLSEVHEVEYLRTRLKKRIWSTSSPGKQVRMGEWKGFGDTHSRLMH